MVPRLGDSLGVVGFFEKSLANKDLGGTAQHRGSVCASYSAVLGSIPGVPEIFYEKNFSQEKIVNHAKVNQRRCCLEQWTAEA